MLILTLISIAYHAEGHLKKVDALEADGKVLFGGNTISGESMYLLFNCKDETVPYDFIKSVSVIKLTFE